MTNKIGNVYANKVDMDSLQDMVDRWNSEGYVRTMKVAEAMKDKATAINQGIVKAFYAETAKANNPFDSLLGDYIIPTVKVAFDKANDAEVKASSTVATFTGLGKAQPALKIVLWQGMVEAVRRLSAGYALKIEQVSDEAIKAFERLYSMRYEDKAHTFSKTRIERAINDCADAVGIKDSKALGCDINRAVGFVLKRSAKGADGILSPSQVEAHLMKVLQRIRFELQYDYVDAWKDAQEAKAVKKAQREAERKARQEAQAQQEADIKVAEANATKGKAQAKKGK